MSGLLEPLSGTFPGPFEGSSSRLLSLVINLLLPSFKFSKRSKCRSEPPEWQSPATGFDGGPGGSVAVKVHSSVARIIDSIWSLLFLLFNVHIVDLFGCLLRQLDRREAANCSFTISGGRTLKNNLFLKKYFNIPHVWNWNLEFWKFWTGLVTEQFFSISHWNSKICTKNKMDKNVLFCSIVYLRLYRMLYLCVLINVLLKLHSQWLSSMHSWRIFFKDCNNQNKII